MISVFRMQDRQIADPARAVTGSLRSIGDRVGDRPWSAMRPAGGTQGGASHLSQISFVMDRSPVPASEVQVESVGVNTLDQRRVDVAVDLTPCLEPVNVEMVIVGPEDDELCSVLLVQNREWALDKILHLRRDAEPGAHTLHVGVFSEGELVARAARTFAFPAPASG